MYRVIPVVVLHDEEEALRSLSALCEGGLPLAEITFRTPYAAQAIALARARFPQMAIGAGSVATVGQAQLAVKSGAQFLVSPGLSAEILALCRTAGLPYLPGAVTPTELMSALSMGVTTVKFFPAGVFGGLKAIKSLSAPFPQLKFVPTGGVNLQNLGEYLACPQVAAVGGSFMMQGDIAENCRAIAKIAGEV